MDLDEEIKSREEVEIGSESREKGDLLPCSSPLRMARNLGHQGKVLIFDLPDHESCHLALHWSRENMHFTVT